MLNNRQLTKLRVINDRFLPDRCTIQRDTRVADGKGGMVLTPSSLATNVKCRLSRAQLRGTEDERGGKLTAVADWTIYLPHGQDITTKDRIIISTLNNRTFQVLPIQLGSYSVGLRVPTREIV